MKKENIALVGGGLAGSLLAVVLARKGFKVSLFERRPDMRKGKYEGGRSINLALSTRGIHALQQVGLADSVLQEAIPMSGRMMHAIDGKLTYQPYGKQGQYINSVSRGGLNFKLLDMAEQYENVTLYFNAKCEEADLDNNSFTIKDAVGNLKDYTADVVIGTDGAFSAIRYEMQKTNRFNFSQDYQNYGYKELEITGGPNGEFRIEKNALHIWPRGDFMMIALPNPGGCYTCTLFMAFEGEISFEKLKSKEEVETFFNQWFPDAVALMPNLVEDFFANPVGSLATMRCNPWVYKRFALMGDAAHAVVPFYGQGMNASFEDVVVFSEMLDKYYPDWDSVLNAYQKTRIPNANAIADLAIGNFIEMRDFVGKESFLQKKKLEQKLSEMYPDLYKTQYELVTFSTVPYKTAQEQGIKNDKLLAKIMNENLESRLEDRNFVAQLIAEYHN